MLMQRYALLEIERGGKYTNLFPKYWNKGHLLMENGLYVYKGGGWPLSGRLVLKKRMVSFVKDLGYPEGVVPQDEASKKCLKLLIDTRLLMNAHAREERKIIYYQLACSWCIYFVDDCIQI